tara:strand:- start:1073 stop:1237 length:165 start_codon:yes stop_codon:yes gene_type:complete
MWIKIFFPQKTRFVERPNLIVDRLSLFFHSFRKDKNEKSTDTFSFGFLYVSKTP